jgi:hypothetical protein
MVLHNHSRSDDLLLSRCNCISLHWHLNGNLLPTFFGRILFSGCCFRGHKYNTHFNQSHCKHSFLATLFLRYSLSSFFIFLFTHQDVYPFQSSNLLPALQYLTEATDTIKHSLHFGEIYHDADCIHLEKNT